MTDMSQLPVAQERVRRINEKLRRELGPIVCGFLDDPEVIEVMLNPDGRLWVERLGQPMVPAGIMSATQAESLMATVAATLRTTITRENPILECELPLDGSRFEAWIPPVVAAPTFTIRRKASKVFSLADYVVAGIMTDAQRHRGGGARLPQHPGGRRHRHRQDHAHQRHHRGHRAGDAVAPPVHHRGYR
jgi:type IV secretion system protein VirB11